MPSSSRLKVVGSTSGRSRSMDLLRCRLATRESASRPRIRRRCSRSSGRSGQRTRGSMARCWPWRWRGSSSSYMADGFGSRASWEQVRRSRSRCQCAVANELILIVEDNPTNLKLVRDTLQAKGYRTIDAGTGEEGVQLAREQQPALVLMDIQLPG